MTVQSSDINDCSLEMKKIKQYETDQMFNNGAP